jgi:hypothetical protein
MLGKQATARVELTGPDASLQETDLMEWNDGPTISASGGMELRLKPFEIRTYKLHR